MATPSTILIPQPRLEKAAGLHRVAAVVDGTEVFFESSLPLVARSESLVSAFLLPAMARGADLEVAGPLGDVFLANLAFVRSRATQWWPQLSAGRVRAATGEEAPRLPDAGVFYTGGADSSYALQQLHPRLRYAVFAEGFDIKLDDARRLAGAREWLSRTARACDVAFAIVRTNLRSHPLFRSVSWEITHGAALASIAHALAGVVGTMYLAASDVQPPWGSEPELDAAWSSESMRLENFSAELSRLQRVSAIARWEPLRGRLRVCWENKSSDLNCGICEKCVRTRLQLHASGAPDGLDSFPRGRSLRSAIRNLDFVQHEIHAQWREVAARVEEPAIRREVERLLARRKAPVWRRSVRNAGKLARRAARWASRRAASIF